MNPMPQSFSIAGDRCAVTTEPALREEIQTHTRDVIATSRILSSIRRFGVDPSIHRFEMTPRSQYRMSRNAGGLSWRVSAVR